MTAGFPASSGVSPSSDITPYRQSSSSCPVSALQNRGFSCSVRPDQSQDLALSSGQISTFSIRGLFVISYCHLFCSKDNNSISRDSPYSSLAITHRTTGAPNTAVTVLMLNSVGANSVRASRSQNRQNTLPSQEAGRYHQNRFCGFSAWFLTSCGTAIPTKEIGPANATIHADRMLERITIRMRNSLDVHAQILRIGFSELIGLQRLRHQKDQSP